MKEKFFWLCIIIIGISGIGNYIYFQSKQLEHPIFLEHYIAKDIYNQDDIVTLTFYYLINKQEPVHVAQIAFDDFYGYPVENFGGTWFHNEPMIHYHQEFLYYYLVPVTVEFPADAIPFNGNDSWRFTNMTVFFSNGFIEEVPIGEVILSQYKDSKISGLQQTMSSGSGNGFSEDLYLATMDIEITEINHPFINILNDQVAMKIDTSNMSQQTNPTVEPDWLTNSHYENWDSKDGLFITEKMEPIEVEDGGSVRVYSQVRANIPMIIEFPIEIKGITKNGDSFSDKAYVNGDRYFDDKVIKAFISSKRAGENHE